MTHGVPWINTWDPMHSSPPRRAPSPRSSARTDDLSSVVDSLRHIVRALRLSSGVAEDRLGVSGAQLFVMQQLAEAPASSLREVAARTLTDQSSVSVVVSRLVRSGLVSRRTSSTDARRAELSLTAKGKTLLAKAPELAHVRLVEALERSRPLELRTVARVLGEVAKALGAGAQPPDMFFEKPRGKSR